ncbi:MAG: ferredoxin reductase [Solirubrobacteraceae bacterium]|nr:ferredoxin reductase [Solirubrobacteraceae bacterium]
MSQAQTLAEPVARRRLLDAAAVLTTPLLPDDYLTVFNPLWAFGELRGRVEQVIPRTDDAATIVVRPSRGWPRHRAGQHVAVGVDVNGVRHWRSYSLTSDPERPDGCLSITVKLVDGGAVSTQLVRHTQPGDLIRLGPPAGDFGLPAEVTRAPLLFVTAGSGITPVMAILRSLERQDLITDVVHIHSERTSESVIFGEALRGLAARNDGVTLHERHTATAARLAPSELDRLCPDWRDRETYACGPLGLLDALETHFEAESLLHQLHVERFQIAQVVAAPGDGGTVRASLAGTTFDAPAGASLLVAAENAGLPVKSGCRMGICHTCVCELKEGQVRDLRTGELIDEPGQFVQLCVSAAAGDVELVL